MDCCRLPPARFFAMVSRHSAARRCPKGTVLVGLYAPQCVNCCKLFCRTVHGQVRVFLRACRVGSAPGDRALGFS